MTHEPENAAGAPRPPPRQRIFYPKRFIRAVAPTDGRREPAWIAGLGQRRVAWYDGASMTWIRALGAALVGLASACQGGGEAGLAPLSEPLVALPAPDAGEVVLDVRADGAALFGLVLPAPVGSDPVRRLRLRSAHEGRPLAGALEGREVLDARFAFEGLLVLHADRVLRLHGPGGAREIDAAVEGPLSVEADQVAYVRGEVPDLEVTRADLRTGAIEAVTEGLAPCGSPALSPDGRALVFVCGAEGRPRLYRADAAGLRALPFTDRFPTAASAPRWRGDTLWMEDERGVAALDVRDGSVRREVPDARELVVLPDGRALSRAGSALAPLGGAR